VLILSHGTVAIRLPLLRRRASICVVATVAELVRTAHHAAPDVIVVPARWLSRDHARRLRAHMRTDALLVLAHAPEDSVEVGEAQLYDAVLAATDLETELFALLARPALPG
jgi:hypothetical protein